MTGWVVIDYETASGTDLIKCGAWKYSECPTTEVLSLALCNHLSEKEPWLPGMPVPKLWLRGLAEGWTFIAFGVGFEKAITRNIQVPWLDWPNVPNEQWHDIASLAAMKALPQSLGPLALHLRLPVTKDEEGSEHTKGLSKPNKQGWLDRSEASLARSAAYGIRDVDTEVEAHLRLGFLPPEEHRLWLHDQSMNERGIRIDRALVAQAQKIVDGVTGPLLREFQEITGIEKIGSPKFKDWLHAQGIHLDNLRAETIVDALGDDTDDETIVEDQYAGNPPFRAMRIRQLIGSSSIKKLAAMRRCMCADGRVRGLFKWHGTSPGRAAGQLLQAQNFPRGTVEVSDIDKNGVPYMRKPKAAELVPALMTGDYQYVEMLIGPPIPTVVTSLRHMIEAEPGKLFISGDYAGIQARVVLALAGQHDKAQLMADGQDVYCDMASSIYGHVVDKKLHPEKRQAGKNSVLGCGFGMGAKTFHIKYCKKQPMEFAQRCITAYRKEWAPRVPKLWYGLEEAATRTVWDRTPHEYNGIQYRLEDGWLTCRSPAGSKIWYRNPQPVKRLMPWSTEDEPDIRPGFTYNAWKNKHWISIPAFGGQLTENIVMRIEVDIKNAGLCNLEEAGFPVVLDVHDELVAELANPDEKMFEQCLLDLPNWINDISISVAIDKPWIADRYKK